MTTSRETLKGYFSSGARPTENQFGEAWDAFIHKSQDGLYLDEAGNLLVGSGGQPPASMEEGVRLDVNGALKVGNNPENADPPPGTIRWTGSDFEGMTNDGWKSLTLEPDDIDLPRQIWRYTGGTASIIGAESEISTSIKLTGKLGALIDFISSGSSPWQAALGCGPGTGLNSKSKIFFDFDGAANGIEYLFESNGEAKKPGGGNWSSSSDSRVKKGIRDFQDGLNVLKTLQPKSFKYNGKGGTPRHQKEYVGFIAQEVLQAYPSMVSTYRAKLNEEDEQETELYSIDTTPLAFILLNAVIELDKRLEALEGKKQK